ncbi:hypothetical protein H5410_046914 [Solanum commersonii]|uniref:Uncharacterized protein n=1 Tax=Solanum commersonii TaxID=4109 RepID=A0A9J5XHQ7_SOLCO|nr:hypothetical protein H5410_046914 [Solanum commersonii]
MIDATVQASLADTLLVAPSATTVPSEATLKSVNQFDIIPLWLLTWYLELEAKHGHYWAERNKAAEKNEEKTA